jgi:hypothetical protein
MASIGIHDFPEVRSPSALVLSDENLGFRNHQEFWPVALQSGDEVDAIVLKRDSFDLDQIPAVASAVAPLGLRGAASQFGISHEMIRRVIVAAGKEPVLNAHHAERDARIRELAKAGVAWAKIAEEVGLSTWRVRSLCAGFPTRHLGRPKGVTE